MGAYTCEYGIVHKVCRCPTEHTIKCDQPEHHAVNHAVGTAPCYRMQHNKLGRHEQHESHLYGYTSEGGGHYLDAPDPKDDRVKTWVCPGRTD